MLTAHVWADCLIRKPTWYYLAMTSDCRNEVLMAWAIPMAMLASIACAPAGDDGPGESPFPVGAGEGPQPTGQDLPSATQPSASSAPTSAPTNSAPANSAPANSAPSAPTNSAPSAPTSSAAPVDGPNGPGTDVPANTGPAPGPTTTASAPSTPSPDSGPAFPVNPSPTLPVPNPTNSPGAGGNGPGGEPPVVIPPGGSTGNDPGGTPGGMSNGGNDQDPPAPIEVDCNAAMPTSGAQQHSGNGTGGSGNLAWEIWSNTGRGELTTYSVPAFSAIWNEAGGYLGRLGFEWGGFRDTPTPYETHGTINAYFVANRTGTAGGYSYIGMYGWSNSPCVEWYVVEDSYGNLPFNPGGTTNKGEVDIDGGTYIMYTRLTTGTGGSRCSGENEWIQYYSMRKTRRNCGQISLTEHFDAWKALDMPMGNLLEAKIIVEVGGGTGRVDLPVANVTKTQ